MLKVVFLVSEDSYFVSHRLPLAIAAKAAGHEVTVVTRCVDAYKRICESGISVVHFEMDRRSLNPKKLLCEVFRVARIYRQLRPDLVHHVAIRPVVVGGFAAKLVGIRRVISAIAGLGYAFTAGRKGWLTFVMRRLLRLALLPGHVIVQNPDDRRAITSLGIPESDVTQISGAGVDVAHFRVLPEPGGPKVVMLASRLLWDKGVGEFVAAARELVGRARFVLVGAPDSNNPASIAADQVDEWVQEGVVEWWGASSDMPKILAQAHVVCLPSYREGLPKVLLEAMACGRPCVTTDAPGCRDAVCDGDNGLLVPPQDAAALKAAIESLLDDAVLRRRLGARGRERAETEFSCERVSFETLGIYRRFS